MFDGKTHDLWPFSRANCWISRGYWFSGSANQPGFVSSGLDIDQPHVFRIKHNVSGQERISQDRFWSSQIYWIERKTEHKSSINDQLHPGTFDSSTLFRKKPTSACDIQIFIASGKWHIPSKIEKWKISLPQNHIIFSVYVDLLEGKTHKISLFCPHFKHDS